jgi:hypothetical protein
VAKEYQGFYDYWRDRSASSNFLDVFPYKLSLGADEQGESLLPFHPSPTLGNTILVTKSYDDLFHRTLCLRKNDVGHSKGVVFTGQPGIGTPLSPNPHPVRQLTNTSTLQEKLHS